MAANHKMSKKELRLRRRRRRRRMLFAFEIIILMILIGGLFIFAKMDKMNFTEIDLSNVLVNEEVQNNEVMQGYTTIALVGIDNRESGLQYGNSDTMIIASINNDTKKVKLVSVYRDTYLRVDEDDDGNGIYRKANDAYNRGSGKQLINMLNTNLDLNVQYFVTVDFSAVATVVDLLGGIDMELSEEEIVHLNNYCVETSEVTGLDYEKLDEVAGTYHLNGVQAVAYARIRKTSGWDMRRAARQREIIYKIVEKAKNSDLATLNNIVDEVFPMIYTSLSKVDILKMGMSMLSYDIEDQAGFPHDHLIGAEVEEAMDGYDCLIPVTLESNVIWLHEFLYPEDAYVPSEAVRAYSDRIIEISGFDETDQLEQSEDGSLQAYRQAMEDAAETSSGTE